MRLRRGATAKARWADYRWTGYGSIAGITLITLFAVSGCAPDTITQSGDEVHHLWMAFLIASIVVLVLTTEGRARAIHALPRGRDRSGLGRLLAPSRLPAVPSSEAEPA